MRKIAISIFVRHISFWKRKTRVLTTALNWKRTKKYKKSENL